MTEGNKIDLSLPQRSLIWEVEFGAPCAVLVVIYEYASMKVIPETTAYFHPLMSVVLSERVVNVSVNMEY